MPDELVLISPWEDVVLDNEEMNHVYPLFPIPEAKPAVEKILQVVMR